ncbi:MAG: hypothetical protein OXC95_13780 [Dehalococcoidia bacterium]|nr:hypothetical protein [Dehalococcoidia bacterium]
MTRLKTIAERSARDLTALIAERLTKTIYQHTCRAKGERPNGIIAHAHENGDICIFADPQRADIEWIIAHEFAHILARRILGHAGHGTP